MPVISERSGEIPQLIE